jgi:hypothetical protein
MYAMYAEDTHLRDWYISVHGKASAVRETAGEVHIIVNGTIALYVVDIMIFDAHGLITAIRSYEGRGD